MKCTALLAAEKIIIDREGAHSIINVMSAASVSLEERTVGNQVAQPLPISGNAVSPLTWWIFTMWDPAPEDIGVAFEQVYQVYWPSGDKLVEGRLNFTQKDDLMQHTSFFILGLPVGQLGKIRIVTWLDSNGHRVSDVAETKIFIKHAPLQKTLTQAVPMTK